MLQRKEFEKREEDVLAPYAAKAARSLGRQHKEKECPFRSCFQRDRDRIIHCEAFRRLEYKTQVFVNHEGDYYRTRLTHTLEVAEIARGLARTLCLNEDLVEAIALAHDLGHTPFGHRGEATLNELMSDYGGFEHNRQSFRVVTYLEMRYPEFDGLNLSIEVLDGIVKHVGEYDEPDLEGISIIPHGFPSLEAQVVNVADEIAYMNHDLDDGLASGMLTTEHLRKVRLWSDTLGAVKKDYPHCSPKIARYQVIRRLINLFVTDLQGETKKRIENFRIKTRGDVTKHSEQIVAFSPKIKELTRELKDCLFTNLYHHYRVERMADKSTRIVTTLFNTYLNNSKVLPPTLHKIILRDKKPHRHICDYIAGMTDRYALSEYAKLFAPNERV